MTRTQLFAFLCSIALFHCGAKECPPGTSPNFQTQLTNPGQSDTSSPQVIFTDKGIDLKLLESRGSEAATLVGKQPLQGDFELSFGYSDFHPTAPQVVVDVAASTTKGAQIITMRGHLLQVGETKEPFTAEIDIEDPSNAMPPASATQDTSKSSGRIQLKRTGGTLTVTITPDGEDSLSKSYDAFGTEPVSFQISLTNRFPIPNQEATSSSVHITDFQISGGGSSLMSETFSCENLVPVENQ